MIDVVKRLSRGRFSLQLIQVGNESIAGDISLTGFYARRVLTALSKTLSMRERVTPAEEGVSTRI